MRKNGLIILEVNLRELINNRFIRFSKIREWSKYRKLSYREFIKNSRKNFTYF